VKRATLVTLVLLITACGGGDTDLQVAEGVVIDVDGTLAEVRSFTVRTPDGTDLTFAVPDGLRFHGEVPLGHLRSHLTTGEPIVVSYETQADGSLEAVDVRDAGG
jgi:hypothetical protein